MGKKGDAIDGVLLLDKPEGMSSNWVLQLSRRLINAQKAGHTGTLDPFATGLLPLAFGNATKYSADLLHADKRYEAVLRFGSCTDTMDKTGEITAVSDVRPTRESLEALLAEFTGEIEQIPPMYSALKVDGKKLYELAREGKVIERKARDIEVFDIKVESIDLPEVTMTVHCSKGTYIRTLCNDIGERLGCHGCMKSLLRVRVAGFDLEHALTLSQIQSKVDEGCFDMVMPVDGVFENLPAVHTASDADKLVRNGNKIPAVLTDYLKHSADSDIRYRVYNHEGIFVGVYSYLDETGEFKPVKIFME